jgi:hypothetical protein
MFLNQNTKDDPLQFSRLNESLSTYNLYVDSTSIDINHHGEIEFNLNIICNNENLDDFKLWINDIETITQIKNSDSPAVKEAYQHLLTLVGLSK